MRVFPAAEFFYESPDVAVGDVVQEGELIPGEDESFNHTARVCAVGPGQEALHPARPALQRAAARQAGGVQEDRHRRHHPHGPGRQRAARSMPTDCATRSASTSTRRPASCGPTTTRSTAWATTSRRASSTTSPRRARISASRGTAAATSAPTSTRTASRRPTSVFPVVETIAHAADLGMVFYTGSKFPDEYKKGVFTAQHGSWNRTVPVGARVHVHPARTTTAPPGQQEDFAAGWLTARRRIYRPPGRRRPAARRLAAGLRRFCRRDLPHLVRGAGRLMRAAAAPRPRRAHARRGRSGQDVEAGARSRACAAPATASTARR